MTSLPPSARIIRVPYSEAAMHLGVADAILYAAPAGPNGVQLYDPKERGKHLSFPITLGESGIDIQWVQVADGPHSRRQFPVRWTAFIDFGDSGIEEIDFDAVKDVPMKYLREFCEGVLRLDYEPGWGKITFEERFGMYL